MLVNVSVLMAMARIANIILKEDIFGGTRVIIVN